MDQFGISFLPQANGAEKPPARDTDQYQKAIEILSFRLPRVMGGGGLAPAPLLQSQGSMGQAPQILQALMQMAGMPPQSAPGAPAPPQPMAPPMARPSMSRPQQSVAPRMPAPTPRIIPGVTSTEDLLRKQQASAAPDLGMNAPTPAPMAPEPTRPWWTDLYDVGYGNGFGS